MRLSFERIKFAANSLLAQYYRANKTMMAIILRVCKHSIGDVSNDIKTFIQVTGSA